jgi:hypothetical protein
MNTVQRQNRWQAAAPYHAARARTGTVGTHGRCRHGPRTQRSGLPDVASRICSGPHAASDAASPPRSRNPTATCVVPGVSASLSQHAQGRGAGKGGGLGMVGWGMADLNHLEAPQGLSSPFSSTNHAAIPRPPAPQGATHPPALLFLLTPTCAPARCRTSAAPWGCILARGGSARRPPARNRATELPPSRSC